MSDPGPTSDAQTPDRGPDPAPDRVSGPAADPAVGPALEPGPAPGETTILICSSCRLAEDPAAEPRPGRQLAADARRAAEGTGVAVRHVACLGNCRRGLSAAIYRVGCWTYVFGGLGASSGADLVAGARLFAGSADGFMPFRDRPEALKRGLVARIPPFDSLKDLP